MIDEIFNVMKYFNGSYINQCGELIISDRGNVYFTARNCTNKEDIICKLLEWCSRPIAKGQPYATAKRNIEWRNSLLCGYNNYLGTNFTQEDMYWIYDKLGNAVNHELTLEFINSNYNLTLVRPQERSDVDAPDFQIGQEVIFDGISYEIIDMSSEPYLRFDDGTMHYVMSLRRCGGEFDDFLIINDAQLDSEE